MVAKSKLLFQVCIMMSHHPCREDARGKQNGNNTVLRKIKLTVTKIFYSIMLVFSRLVITRFFLATAKRGSQRSPQIAVFAKLSFHFCAIILSHQERSC